MDPKEALTFVMSGRAIFTLLSVRTGRRFTYSVVRPRRIERAADDGFRYASLMTSPDNTSEYTYVGQIQNLSYSHGRKSKITPDALGVKAFRWALEQLKLGKMPEELEFWHEGQCGACGHRLTVPASIESGIGPECAKRRYKCA
jgi:hypothetical protein